MTSKMELWRIITPIMLSVLSALVSINLFILNGMNATMLNIDAKIERHVANQHIHEALYWELAGVKKQLKFANRQPFVS